MSNTKCFLIFVTGVCLRDDCLRGRRIDKGCWDSDGIGVMEYWSDGGLE